MSTTEGNKHFSSIAQRLEAQGFKKTGVARAVIELVQAYLGISEPSSRIKSVLSLTNMNASSAIETPKDLQVPVIQNVMGLDQERKNSSNESSFSPIKTGTNG